MTETTVCLPDEINTALQQFAAQTGRSPAELVQTAIEDDLSRNQRSLPRSPAGLLPYSTTAIVITQP